MATCSGQVFAEKISGVSKTEREALNDCLAYMRGKGDTLVITKMDRLARSAWDLYNLVHKLELRGIALRVLDQNVDTSTSSGKALFLVKKGYI